jgi:ubiquinone/menaquinone biosynthesis C-methylase UbiE
MFDRFAQRSHTLERLDTGDHTPQEYARWLEEAKLINRWLGDAKALRLTLENQRWIGEANNVSILDVGAGSGELLRSAQAALNGRTGLLVGSELSEAAALAIGERTREFGVVPLRCNGLALPFADKAFDVVVCSLLLHHLTDEQAVRLIGEMNRVASKQFIVIDLFRDPLPYYLYRTFAPFFLQRMTVEDGSLSILRAFRPDELEALARQAGIKDPNVTRAAFRLILTRSLNL